MMLFGAFRRHQHHYCSNDESSANPLVLLLLLLTPSYLLLVPIVVARCQSILISNRHHVPTTPLALDPSFTPRFYHHVHPATAFSFRLCMSRGLSPVLIKLTAFQKPLEPPPFGPMLAPLKFSHLFPFLGLRQHSLCSFLPGRTNVCNH